MPKITCQNHSNIEKRILFNEVIMNLLRDFSLKKTGKYFSIRLINSANPSSNIGKILINKNMKLVMENM